MNVVVFALSEPNAIEAVKRLRQNGIINISAWLGSDKGQGVIDYDYGILANEVVQKNIAKSCPVHIYDKLYSKLYMFLDMAYRNGTNAIYEYVNLFNLYVNFYYGLFSSREIDLLIFGDIPHFGVDSVAKDLADVMGIKTIMFHQGIELNRFFAFTDIKDIGLYETLPNDDIYRITLPQKYEKDLFYMKQIKVIEPGNTDNANNLSVYADLLKKALNSRKRCYVKGRRFILHRFEEYCRKKRVNIEFHDNEERSMSNTEDIDFRKKYVYFPLHLQPEMTTSALGGMYCDQVLAIERLRKLLPDDWYIYVKENPKQSAYMRGEMFFRRLLLIDNLILVDRDINTYDLISNSQFVATITGTAGWEAISGGKCVLVFGLAWYRRLPGAFEYNDRIQYRHIVDYKIDHAELEKEYRVLFGKSYAGVLECGSESVVENYNNEENNDMLYAAFCKIIDNVKKVGHFDG